MPFQADNFLYYFASLQRFRRRPAILRYAVSILTVMLAIPARQALDGLMDSDIPFITFFPAIIISAFLGGRGPGILALALSLLAADFFFMQPMHSFRVSFGDAVALVVFAAVGAVIVVLLDLLNSAIDRISIEQRKAHAILEVAPAGLIAVDAMGKITLVNAAAERLFGYERDELLGQKIEILIPQHVRAGHAALRAGYMKIPSARSMGVVRDLYGLRKDGRQVPVEVGLNSMLQGNQQGALAIVVDISERKEAERKQDILVREVQHRSKNVLQAVQFIARRALTDDRDPAESRQSFLAKLQALAQTHDLFFAKSQATLGDIVRAELAGFLDQVSISGDDLLLTPSAAQNLTLIVHELTINAIKHGTLSTPVGKVTITWRSNATRLLFDWAEGGGPPVEPPTDTGFGTTILKDFATVLGSATVEYTAEGLHYRLAIPLKNISPASPSERSGALRSAPEPAHGIETDDE
ncbi:MAG: PAS domain S-box protein [Hyphomicrobiaceae bacterium]|nr:MAG: PAS domain S-box protein [Hyphomicrobiaceae bacterium]